MLFTRLIAPTLTDVIFNNLLNFFAFAVDHEDSLLLMSGLSHCERMAVI